MKKIVAIFILNIFCILLGAQTLDQQAADAHNLANKGNIQEAKSKCEAILLKNPDHGKTNLVYAMINEYEGRFAEAEQHFLAAEKKIKTDPVLYFRLANLTKSLQSKDPADPNYKFKTAMAYIDKAKTIAPKLYTVYLMYADIAKIYCPGQRLENDTEKQSLYKINMEKYIELGGDDCESIVFYLGNYKNEIKLSTYIKGCNKLVECKISRSSSESLRYVETTALDYIYQNADVETCLKLAKIIQSKTSAFPERVRDIILRCYQSIAIRNKKNVFDNTDYVAQLKAGIENKDYDKLKYYDKLIEVYKYLKKESEWKKLEIEKIDAICYDLLHEMRKIDDELEKFMKNNSNENGRFKIADEGKFSAQDVEKIIEFKKSSLYLHKKLLAIGINTSFEGIAKRGIERLGKEIASFSAAIK